MEYTGEFKKQMQRSVLKKIIVLLLKVSALFIFALLSATYIKNEVAARKSMEHIEQTFSEIFDSNKEFLLDDKSELLYKKILTSNEGKDDFENLIYRHNADEKVMSKAIIVDKNWKIRFSSFDSSELSTYHSNYNNAVSNNAREIKNNEVYTSVYNDGKGYYDYMMIKPINDDNSELLGYITLFLSGDDWSYYMSHYNYNGVITDSRDNVIFYNKPILLVNKYKFNVGKSKITHIGGERYWLNYKMIPEYGVNVYSLVLYPKNPEILIGLIVILIIGVLWYNLATRISETMAEKNTQSIKKLVDEIRIIRKYDQNYRIELNTKDEFEDVAHHINTMVDRITQLNDQNTELLKLNNMIEINHLTAQINPHFLYNTLEIIRNLLMYDKERAGNLIIQLTKVLRYSINNSKRDVKLEEDMMFIHDYLSIQKTRFNDRLICNIEIKEECNTCKVPKLIIQPLIENSIKYGFMNSMTLKIDISGYVKDNYLYLIVSDDGPGMNVEEINDLSKMLEQRVNDTKNNGLYNISRRLKLQYTNNSGVEIQRNSEKGLTVILKIYQADEQKTGSENLGTGEKNV